MPQKARPTESNQVMQIPAPDLRTMEVVVVGDSELICHRFSAKAKQMILDKQLHVAKQAKPAKDPKQDFLDSLYPVSPGIYGFPTSAFKEAAVSACSHVSGVTKTIAKGAFQILGTLAIVLDPHTGKPAAPVMREDTVRIGYGIADIHYRGAFPAWAVRLKIRYNASVISPAELMNLLNTAGFCSGVGEWRPSSPKKSGSHGMFHVEEAPNHTDRRKQ